MAIILPFLSIPKQLRNRHVVLLTDNEPLVYGWSTRRVPHDTTASIFIRALHIIATLLNCSVTIQHLPRMSTRSATLADELTRQSTTSAGHQEAIRLAWRHPTVSALQAWLDHPTKDWGLPAALLNHVGSLL